MEEQQQTELGYAQTNPELEKVNVPQVTFLPYAQNYTKGQFESIPIVCQE